MKRLLPCLLALVLIAACSGDAKTADRTGADSTIPANARFATPRKDIGGPPDTQATTVTPPVAGSPITALPDDQLPSGDRAFQHIEMLAGQIGSRVAGTDGERTAAAYIKSQLEASGFEVELQSFTVRSFVSRSVSVSIPGEGMPLATALTNSVGGQASGDVYSAGLGYPQDYPDGGINGRVALVERGTIEFGEKARNAYAAGASAVIIFEANAGVVNGNLSGTVPPIPVVSIPGAEGGRLRDRARNGSVQASVTFDGGVQEVPSINVIGRPAGKSCSVVVGGHYDSVAGTPGASDNASGTAVVLELARVQSLRGNPEQACFIAFSGEELGLKGSQHYVAQLSEAERRGIKFMLNFDMEAVGTEWQLIGSRDLQTKGQEVAGALGITAEPTTLLGASSDHAAFIDRRIPALMLHRYDDPLLHTPQDTVARITAPPLETSARLGLAFLIAFSSS
jgi:aminopeptidase YwaD